MSIKEKAAIYESKGMSEMLDMMKMFDLDEEKETQLKFMFEKISILLGQAFRMGAIFVAEQIVDAIDEAPKGSNIGDAVDGKIRALIEGL